MMYLLDTDVVSEMRKIRLGKADPNVSAWADSVEALDLYLSVVSVHESFKAGVEWVNQAREVRRSQFAAPLSALDINCG